MKETIKADKTEKKYAWLKWAWRLLLIVIIVPTLLFLLLQIPTIQNWAVDKVTSFLSEKTKTNIEIDKINLSIWDGMQLNGFYLEDQRGDTLLNLEYLEISLHKSLFTVLSKELSLDNVKLINGGIHIVKHKNENASNLEKLLAQLSTSESNGNKKSSSFSLDLTTILLEQIQYTYVDNNTGATQNIHVTEGEVEFDKVDLPNGNISIKSIYFDKPDIEISQNNQEIIVVENKAEKIDTIVVQSDQSANPLLITVGECVIRDGQFKRYDERSARKDGIKNSFDLANMDFTNLNLKVKDFNFSNDLDISMSLDYLTVEDERGFAINEMSADTLSIDSTGVNLQGFIFKTNHTELENDISLSYNDFSDFKDVQNRVFFKSTFNNAKIGLDDLRYFVKALNYNNFFSTNKNRQIILDGKYYGRLNKLSGRDVKLHIDNGLQLEGSFDSRNITDASKALFNVKVEKLSTNMNFLEQVIPDFEIPNNFEKIGNFNFNGRFDGYIKDFVAYGTLNSVLGRSDMDMRLDVKDGTRNANYSGEISVIDFDLKTWTGDDKFGKVNFNSKISNGKGLSLETAFANLSAKVQSLDFKGYTYDDFVLDGQLKKNNFEGVFKIEDENVNFEFEGNIELQEGRPFLNFKVDIKTLDLEKLHLSKEAFAFSGKLDIDMNGKGIDDLVGDLIASNIHIVHQDSSFVIDTISFVSTKELSGNRQLEVYSDIVNASIDGEFKYNSLVNAVKQIAIDNYPFYTKKWSPVDKIVSQDFNFDIHVKDSKNFFSLLGADGLFIQDLKAKGSVSNNNNEIAMTSSIPSVRYNQYQIFGGQFNFNSIKSDGLLSMTIDSTVAGAKSLNAININADMNGDTINLNLNTDDIIDSLERLDVLVEFTPHEKGIQLHLQENELIMLGEKWKFSDDNNIVLGKEYLDITALSLSDDKRKIVIEDIDEEGVELVLENLDLAMANPFLNYDKMIFGGTTNLNMRLYKIYSAAPVITGHVLVDDFLINNENFGRLDVDVSKSNLNPYVGSVSLLSSTHSLKSDVIFDQDKSTLDASLVAKDLPLRIFEFIISEGISNTEGKADINLKLGGPLDNLDLEGDGLLKDGSVKIDYLGATFYYDNQPVVVSRNLLDLTDDIITDEDGNIAIITGGIKHDLFRDFDMDLNISADNAVVINTTKRENPLYYGYAQGRLSVDFTGPFDRANIKVDAVTGENTVLNVPVGYYQDGYDESFIKFVDRDNLNSQEITIINSNDEYKIKGLSIEMNVTLTPEAEVRIIFDESRQDILEGRGDGVVQMSIDRLGAFDVFGEYVINSGNYLFTSGDLIKKRFGIQPGGTIRWNGDPLDATLDIDAEYVVRTPIKVFVAEYTIVDGSPVDQDAKNTHTVVVTLDLTGTIFKPIINFDLSFPDLTGELKTYADSKLRTLRSNEIALNDQVVQLIVFQSFLASSEDVAASSNSALFTNAASNTLSEFVGNQVSNLLTGMLTEVLSDNGLISGIDFKVGLRNNSSIYNASTSGSALDFNEVEFDIRNRFRFLNERLSLKIGGNYVRNVDIVDSNFAGSAVLEYYLTDARKLKVRIYGSSDFDYQAQARRGKYGIGIGYNTEFGSLSEFQDGLNKAVKAAAEKEDKKDKKNQNK